jgi:hypothetical protein
MDELLHLTSFHKASGLAPVCCGSIDDLSNQGNLLASSVEKMVHWIRRAGHVHHIMPKCHIIRQITSNYRDWLLNCDTSATENSRSYWDDSLTIISSAICPYSLTALNTLRILLDQFDQSWK